MRAVESGCTVVPPNTSTIWRILAEFYEEMSLRTVRTRTGDQRCLARKTVLHSKGGCLGPRADVKFVEDVLDVGLGGARARCRELRRSRSSSVRRRSGAGLRSPAPLTRTAQTVRPSRWRNSGRGCRASVPAASVIASESVSGPTCCPGGAECLVSQLLLRLLNRLTCSGPWMC